jgi:hypothetical protein
MSETPPSSSANPPLPSPTQFLPKPLLTSDLKPKEARPERIGPYRIRGPLGAGGIADIYLGFDEEGRPV